MRAGSRGFVNAVLLACSLVALTGCQSNGAVVFQLFSGDHYCQDDWDESEVRERERAADDVIIFRPGKTCRDLLFTKECADTPKTFFGPDHRC